MVSDAQPAQDAAALWVGHTVGQLDAGSQLSWQGKQPRKRRQRGFQQAGLRQDATPDISSNSHTAWGGSILHSKVVWAPSMQPATSRAARLPPTVIQSRKQEQLQSLPPPQAGMPALQGAPAASRVASLPASCSRPADTPLQETASIAGPHSQASNVPEQRDLSSQVGLSVAVRGASNTFTPGSPYLDLLINMLAQQPLPAPGALASSQIDLVQGGSLSGPQSMLSADCMEPGTPQL